MRECRSGRVLRSEKLYLMRWGLAAQRALTANNSGEQGESIDIEAEVDKATFELPSP